MGEKDALKRILERERKARKASEKILEEKSLELFKANQELKKLYSSLENRYENLVEQANDIIYRGDENGFCTFVNGGAYRVLGYSKDELLGKHFTELIKRDQIKDVIHFYQKQWINRQENTYFEFAAKTKKGETIWLGQNVTLVIENGVIKGISAVARDITLQRQLMTQLEKAKAAAEESSKAKETFLAHMSHEIRTPLNSVLGMTHLLQETNPSKEQKEYLETIQYSSEILLNIISDILDISKIEAGEAVFNETTFDLTELVKAQHKAFALRMQERAVEVMLELDENINTLLNGDKTFLNQILMNLLGNAAKFTHKGSITIKVKKGTESAEQVQINFSIEDTGIGIEKKQLEQIFESFKQAEQSTRLKYGGTGLGLSIAKHLVELHNGKISVESEVGVGTKFHFSIPYSKTSIPLHVPSPKKVLRDHQKLKGVRVLVVEDNAMNQKFLSKVLEKNNMEFTICDNGQLALQEIQNNRYDLILMDIQMPVMNGYETTEAIRRLDHPNKNVPIIALTASALVDERKKALASGMDEHLSKPFTPDQLRVAIENLMFKTSSIPTVDLDHDYIDTLYDGDLEFKAQMLALFLENVETEMKQLKLAAHEENHSKVQQIAHKNKPSFKMCGLSKFEQLLQQIENLSSKGDLYYQELTQQLINQLPSVVSRVEEELKQSV